MKKWIINVINKLRGKAIFQKNKILSNMFVLKFQNYHKLIDLFTT